MVVTKISLLQPMIFGSHQARLDEYDIQLSLPFYYFDFKDKKLSGRFVSLHKKG